MGLQRSQQLQAFVVGSAVRETIVSPETRLFFSRWLAHPTKVAALYPSSSKLSALIASKVLRGRDEAVLEVGAGTGAIGRALVQAGLAQEQLAMIELDEAMCEHLRAEFPDALVMQGDALRPSTLMPEAWRGQVTTCVSGLPVLHCSLNQQRDFVEDAFSLMSSERRLVQYSNCPFPPLLHRDLKLSARRLGFGWSGVIPHFIWEFRPE